MGTGGSKTKDLYRISHPEHHRGEVVLFRLDGDIITDLMCGKPKYGSDGSITMVSGNAAVPLTGGAYEFYSSSSTYRGQLPTYTLEFVNIKIVNLQTNDIVYLPLSWGGTKEPFSFCYAKVKGQCAKKRGLLTCGFTNDAMASSKNKTDLESILLEPERMVSLVVIHFNE